MPKFLECARLSLYALAGASLIVSYFMEVLQPEYAEPFVKTAQLLGTAAAAVAGGTLTRQISKRDPYGN